MTRPALATDRASLILQLVPYLIERGEVTLIDAATEFEVTPGQMRKMVQSLTFIGRPGDADYWAMPNDLFDIDWDLLENEDVIVITNTVGLEAPPRLTAREAAALLAGLQLARSLPGVGDTEVLAGLLAKLARGASAAPAELILAPTGVDEVRIAVAEALRLGVAVSFEYRAPDAPVTRRTVDPFTVLISDGQWYVQGWCHLRRASRTFHLDRVSDLRLTPMPVTHRQEAPPALFGGAEAADQRVRVRFAESARALVGDYLDGATTDAHDGMVVAALRVADAASLKRLVARTGGAVEILDPIEARQAAADWARGGLAQYS